MEYYSNFRDKRPLAERMRPESLEEFVGQKHIVGKDMLLDRAIRAGVLGSCIFLAHQEQEKQLLLISLLVKAKGKWLH